MKLRYKLFNAVLDAKIERMKSKIERNPLFKVSIEKDGYDKTLVIKVPKDIKPDDILALGGLIGVMEAQ